MYCCTLLLTHSSAENGRGANHRVKAAEFRESARRRHRVPKVSRRGAASSERIGRSRESRAGISITTDPRKSTSRTCTRRWAVASLAKWMRATTAPGFMIRSKGLARVTVSIVGVSETPGSFPSTPKNGGLTISVGLTRLRWPTSTTTASSISTRPRASSASSGGNPTDEPACGGLSCHSPTIEIPR